VPEARSAAPPRCLFVINDLARAGAEKQASLLALGLRELGWSVSFVLIKERNDFADPLAAASIPVAALHRRGPFDQGIVGRLRRVIAESSPDVVVSFLFLANLLTVLASRSLKNRPKVVVSVRESYQRNHSAIHRLIARLAHRSADLTIVNSMSILREEEAGFPKTARIVHLPNAVVPRPEDPVPWPAFGARGGGLVVSVGQLAPVKGHRILIEAFASVAGANPDVRLALVGAGPEEPGLRALALARGVSDRVLFIGHQEDPLPFMAAADLFVQPSLSEGMSNSLMEAMSLGRCIVATRVGAAPDVLEDEVHALLCPPTAAGLAAALNRALGDPGLRHRLGEAARRRSRDFSIDRIAGELDALLRDAVRRR